MSCGIQITLGDTKWVTPKEESQKFLSQTEARSIRQVDQAGGSLGSLVDWGSRFPVGRGVELDAIPMGGGDPLDRELWPHVQKS